MGNFFIGTLSIDSCTSLGIGLVTRKTLLILLLLAASTTTAWGQCAGEVSTAANAASCTARSIPQATVTSLDPKHSYSLAELIDIAEHNNPGTRIAWERAKQRADELGIARSAYYPVLAGVAAFAAERTIVPVPKALVPEGYVTTEVPLVQPEVTLQYVLFDSGKRKARVDAATAQALAAGANSRSRCQQSAFQPVSVRPEDEVLCRSSTVR